MKLRELDEVTFKGQTAKNREEYHAMVNSYLWSSKYLARLVSKAGAKVTSVKPTGCSKSKRRGCDFAGCYNHFVSLEVTLSKGPVTFSFEALTETCSACNWAWLGPDVDEGYVESAVLAAVMSESRR